MICFNCRKQIPDNSNACPFCNVPIEHKEQVKKEISFRRYQRWVLYGVIVFIFVGMIAMIVRVYNANSALLLKIANVQNDLTKAKDDLGVKESELTKVNTDLQTSKTDLETARQAVEAKDKLAQEMELTLTQKTEELDKQTSEYKQVLDEKVQIEEKQKGCELDLTSADANIYNLIIRLGQGVTNDNLRKIKVADANLDGTDQDEDGLSDEVEASLGTDPAKVDTDGDTYSDKQEIIAGYNPNGTGVLRIDQNFVNQMKGKILLQVEGDSKAAWYVGSDGLRYYMGTPTNAFQTIRSIDYWIKGYAPIVNEILVSTTVTSTTTNVTTTNLE